MQAFSPLHLATAGEDMKTCTKKWPATPWELCWFSFPEALESFKENHSITWFWLYTYWFTIKNQVGLKINLVSTGREPSCFSTHPVHLWQWLSLTVCLLGRESKKIQFIKFCHAKSSVFFQRTEPIPSSQRSGKYLWVSVTMKDKSYA